MPRGSTRPAPMTPAPSRPKHHRARPKHHRARPKHHRARPNHHRPRKARPPHPPGAKGPPRGPSRGMVVAGAAVDVAVVLADEMPVATANAAPDTRPAASTSVADRDRLHLGAIR